MYPKLIVLVMLTDVFLSAMVGLGVYFGFSIHPAHLLGIPQSPLQSGFHATIPLWMPSIQDLKVPLSYLPSRGPGAVWATLLFSAAVLVVQSYARAIYLGGLKSAVLQERPSPLREYGKRYFKRMLGWTALHTAVGLAGMMLALWAGPIGAIVFIAIFFYSLAPYLIVLRDDSLSQAIASAPSVFRAYFWSMVPFALLTLFFTGIFSAFNFIAKPYNYYVCMLIYSCAGTNLIGEFMRRLHEKLRNDLKVASPKRAETIPFSRMKLLAAIASIFVVPAIGVWFSSGYPLQAVDRAVAGAKSELSGVSYHSGFSDVMYASDQMYDSYAWQPDPYRIRIALPDMSNGRVYDELRGTATVYWDVSVDKVTRSGNTITHRVEKVPTEQTILYRLVRERSEDGSFYYSSRSGSASILALVDKAREAMSVEMTVSGDGRHVFVLQYPTRFEAGPLFRVSSDGQFFVPRASKQNPGDFNTYWFSSDLRKQDVLDMLESKNEHSGVGPRRLFVQLAVALQEADGAMVKRVLKAIEGGKAKIAAPDWTERQWTDYLRNQYERAGLAEMLGYMTKAGIQSGYESRQLSPAAEQPATGSHAGSTPEQQQQQQQQQAQQQNSLDQPKQFSMEIPFPNQPIVLVYEIDRTDKLLSLDIRLTPL